MWIYQPGFAFYIVLSDSKGIVMRYEAIFDDAPEMLAVRREREALHIEYLRTHRSEILIAGGLREEAGGAFVGGMWVFEVESKERAVALIENDLYFVPACRTYRLLVWGKALPELAVVL
jgi:uncharacterized protein YciI